MAPGLGFGPPQLCPKPATVTAQRLVCSCFSPHPSEETPPLPRELTPSLLSVPHNPLEANSAFCPSFLNSLIKAPVESAATTEWAPDRNAPCRLGQRKGRWVWHLAPAVSVGVQGHGGAPDADLHHALTVQETLVHAAAEGRPVVELLSEGLVSRVHVSVHVQQPHRAMPDDNRQLGGQASFWGLSTTTLQATRPSKLDHSQPRETWPQRPALQLVSVFQSLSISE